MRHAGSVPAVEPAPSARRHAPCQLLEPVFDDTMRALASPAQENPDLGLRQGPLYSEVERLVRADH